MQQAFIVENIQREEQLRLDEETKRKIEQQKKGPLSDLGKKYYSVCVIYFDTGICAG